MSFCKTFFIFMAAITILTACAPKRKRETVKTNTKAKEVVINPYYSTFTRPSIYTNN